MKVRIEGNFVVNEANISDEQYADGFRDKWKIIAEMSKHLSFLPTVKEYFYSGTMLVYKFDRFDFIPIKQYLRDFKKELYSHAVVPELNDLVVLKDTLLYDWPNQIQRSLETVNYSSFNNAFFHGSVITNEGDMLFLDLHTIEIFPLNIKIMHAPYPPLARIVDGLLDNEDQKQLLRFYSIFLKPLEMQKEIDILEDDLRRRQEYIDKKNKQLENSLNKDRVKEAIGEDLYYLHFGEEDE